MIRPYIRFAGNCEEAFNFYAEAFGGKVEHISRYDSQPGFENETVGKVMHASVNLMGSGGIDGSDSTDLDLSTYNPEIIAHFSSRGQVEEVFAKLSKDAKTAESFTPHPPPDDGGGGAYIVDKYGVHWMLCA